MTTSDIGLEESRIRGVLIGKKSLLDTKPPPCSPIEKGGLGEGKKDVPIKDITYSISQTDSITFS
jgi:hypothetical protein